MAASVSALRPTPAKNSSLAGFEAVCSCGLVLRSSLRTIAEQDVVAHLAWHQRKEARS